MKAIIMRYMGDGRYINMNLPQIPNTGESIMLDGVCENKYQSEQVRAFLDKEEGYSPCFKVTEVVYRLNQDPVVFIKNINA